MAKETLFARLALIGGVILMLILPLVLTQDWSGISFLETGPIGDTIGGVTAPISGLLGAYLVFLALKAQVKANVIQKEAMEKQQNELFKRDTLGYIERQKEKIESSLGGLFENRNILKNVDPESVKFNIWMVQNIQRVKHTMMQTYLFLDFVNHKSKIEKDDPILRQLLNDFYLNFEAHELTLLSKIDRNIRWDSADVNAKELLPIIKIILQELEVINKEIVQKII